MTAKGKLTFFCGKMGAGKSTYANRVAAQSNAVLVSEDSWLAAHFYDQIANFDDYLHYSRLIKPFIKSHVQSILNTGTNVVMDFPANTVSQRAWFTALCDEIDCDHQLVYLDVADRQCLTQIAKRRSEQPARAHFDTPEVFAHVTQFFEAPSVNEKLNIITESASA
ncbi:AAA family ATPase [Pseudoalteromonas sp. T1lg65]|uniref:AAA family ATPase n=1 Tax=Pseudoalteromonas sp. T1lg65 TaxID=2077101 RepID=UPI003F7A24A7